MAGPEWQKVGEKQILVPLSEPSNGNTGDNTGGGTTTTQTNDTLKKVLIGAGILLGLYLAYRYAKRA